MRVSEGRARERERERERESGTTWKGWVPRSDTSKCYKRVLKSVPLQIHVARSPVCLWVCVSVCVCVRAATFPQSLRPTRCAFFNSSLRCLCWNAHAHIYSQLMLFRYSERQTALQFRITSDHVLDTSGQLYQHLRRVSHSYNTESLDQWHDDIFVILPVNWFKNPYTKVLPFVLMTMMCMLTCNLGVCKMLSFFFLLEVTPWHFYKKHQI